jgi:hypothetical protein
MSTKKIGSSLEGKIEVVELASLQVDESYQRPLKSYHKKISIDFNPAAAGVLHVGRRPDSSLWIIDGQQRREAMMLRGITKWKALVVHSSGTQYEAMIFRLLNNSDTRKALNPSEIFRAALVAQDPVAQAAMRAVESAGLRLKLHKGGSRGFPELPCVRVIYAHTRDKGEEVVYRALKLMVDTWPGQDDTMYFQIPDAMIKLIASQGDLVDDERFSEVLGKVPPRKILLDSKVGLGDKSAATLRTICTLYNKRLTQAKQLKVYNPESESA